jgi:hypothetical protein
MFSSRIPRPSAAMAVALIALIAALSGTAVALPGVNTVDSGDIKNGQVKRVDVATGAVTLDKVSNGSLLAKDFAPGQLPAGAKGDKGDTGAPGSALAFGRITSNGTVDAANSKNVAVAHIWPTGVYCLVVPAGARNIIAQVEVGAPAVATASVDPGDALIMCPPGPSNAVVALSSSAGGIAMRDFMVLVN